MLKYKPTFSFPSNYHRKQHIQLKIILLQPQQETNMRRISDSFLFQVDKISITISFMSRNTAYRLLSKFISQKKSSRVHSVQGLSSRDHFQAK